MRLVVFVDEFTLRAPLHGFLQEKLSLNGARGSGVAREVFPLEGEYTLRKTNTMEITGDLVLR